MVETESQTHPNGQYNLNVQTPFKAGTKKALEERLSECLQTTKDGWQEVTRVRVVLSLSKRDIIYQKGLSLSTDTI